MRCELHFAGRAQPSKGFCQGCLDAIYAAGDIGSALRIMTVEQLAALGVSWTDEARDNAQKAVAASKVYWLGAAEGAVRMTAAQVAAKLPANAVEQQALVISLAERACAKIREHAEPEVQFAKLEEPVELDVKLLDEVEREISK